MALIYYSRVRFILNLLPLLRHAPGLRRVVSVFAGHNEGHFHKHDIQARHVAPMSRRPHLATMVTLSLEAFAAQAPEVSFVHDNPGNVKTKMRDVPLLRRAASALAGAFTAIPKEQSGDRHLFLATSAMYGPLLQKGTADGDRAAGVPLVVGVRPAIGTNGQVESGVYTVDSDGETHALNVQKQLKKSREHGDVQRIKEHTDREFVRITGTGMVA